MREFRSDRFGLYRGTTSSPPLTLDMPVPLEMGSSAAPPGALPENALPLIAERLPAIFAAGASPRKPIHSHLRSVLVPLAFKLRRLMNDTTYLNLMYYLSLGSVPRFAAPRTFNELINYRKLYDRNPDFVTTSDKYAVRGYVTQRVGEQHLIPLILQATNPLEIDVARLPKSFAVKLNHGSGFNIFVRNKNEINWSDIVLKLQRWLRFPYHNSHREWAYKQITPRVLVEELLQDASGRLPEDYKFHVFHGKVRMIQVHYDRFGKQRLNLFNENYRRLKVRYQAPLAPEHARPPNRLRDMVDIAEKLAAGFVYARIDLYEHLGQIYFGEITHYPAAGIGVFDPPEFDRVLGALWLDNTPIPDRYLEA